MAAKPDSVNRRRAALGLAAALALPLAACAPDVPATPTYTKDVKVILDAHCVRCHGANGMLNPIPGLTTPQPKPQACYLQQYEDPPAPGLGAASCAAMFPTYISAPYDLPTRMPPKPSDPLSDYENDVLTRWGSIRPPPQ